MSNHAASFSCNLPTREDALAKYKRLHEGSRAVVGELTSFLAQDNVGNALRSHLCGRDPTIPTSIEYFYNLRLFHSGITASQVFVSETPAALSNDFCDRLSTSLFAVIDYIIETEKPPRNTINRSMFLTGQRTGKVKATTLKALFGCSPHHMSFRDHELSSLEKRVSTVKLAVFFAKERYPPNVCVQTEDAERAYRVMHKCDPQDGKLLRDWTIQFGTKLKSALESEFLDVSHGLTDPKFGVESCDAERHPSVTTFKAGSPDDGDEFCVWHGNNIFSPRFVEQVIEELDQFPFFDSNIDANHAQNERKMAPRFGRAVSFGVAPIAMEVKGKFQPAAPEAAPCEVQIREFATMFAQLQNEFVRQLVGADVPITIDCNLLHVVSSSVRGSSYGQHSDTSVMTTSCEGNPIWMNAEQMKRLPTKSELQTISFFVSNVPDACHLLYSHTRDLKKKVPLLNLTTKKSTKYLTLGECGFHWQGPMSQDSYQHWIEAMQKDERALRAIFSCRFSIDGGILPILYKQALMKAVQHIPTLEEQLAMYHHYDVLKTVREGGCQVIQPSTSPVAENTDATQGSSDRRTRSNRNPSPNYGAASSTATSVLPQKRKAHGSATVPTTNTGAPPTANVDTPNASGGPPNETNGFPASVEALLDTNLPADVPLPQQQMLFPPGLDYNDCRVKAHRDYNLKTKWKDSFLFLSTEDYDKKGLHRTGKKITAGWSSEQVLQGNPMIKRMLLEHALVAWTPRYNKQTGKVTKMVPTLFMNRVNGQRRLFQIGKLYPGNSIALMAGFNRSMKQRDVYTPNQQQAAIASESYKNELETVLAAQKAKDPTFLKVEGQAIVIKHPPEFDENDILCLLGSGGATVAPGQYTPDLLRKTKDTADIVIPPRQNPHDGGTNEALDNLCSRKGVVAVFSQYQNFNEGHKPPSDKGNTDKDTLQFLGYYYFVDRTFRADTEEETKRLEASMVGASKKTKEWSNFRTRPYLKFHLKRLFNKEEWAALRLREERANANHQIYRHIAVDQTLENGLSRSLQMSIAESFVWNEKVTGEKEVIDHCFRPEVLYKFSQDEEPETLIPTPKPSGVGITPAEDDVASAKTDPPLKPIKGTSGSIIQCLVAVLLTTQAAFQRFLGKSLQHSTSTQLIHEAIAVPLDDPALPLVNRMRAFPSGNRAMDLINDFNRSEWEVYREKYSLPIPSGARVHFDRNDDTHWKDFTNLLFRVILLRMTGRIQRFFVYQKFMKEVMGQDVAQLPELGTSDVEWFLFYVQAEIGEKGKSMSSWISTQHQGQIPKVLRDDVDKFVFFVTQLNKKIPQNVQSISELSSRALVVQAITNLLLECVACDAKEVAFIAQAAMLDVEELYSGIFPEPSPIDANHIIGGPGSDYGFGVLKNSGSASTIAIALERMLAEMNQQSPEFLFCFGAHRKPDELFARWTINDRPLNLYDMEHFLCKVKNFSFHKHPLVFHLSQYLIHTPFSAINIIRFTL